MATYDLISENDESTVVAQFDRPPFASEGNYISEKKLEDRFVYLLEQQQYEFVPITSEAELVANLRKQIEKLSAYLAKFKDLTNDNLDNDDEDTMWNIPDPEPIEKIVSVKEAPKPMVGENGGVKAISIYQPWAQMLACGITQVENRNWTVDERGTFLIAASSVKLDWEKLDPAARGEYKKYQKMGILPDYDDLPTNAIVGQADLVGIVSKCRLVGFNPAFKHHFVVKNAKVLDVPILNHQTGKKFYETEILPTSMPPSTVALCRTYTK